MPLTAAAVSKHMQKIAQGVDLLIQRITGEQLGFIVLVWAGGEVNYAGTDSERTRTIKAMRELIAKWEANLPETPAHERH